MSRILLCALLGLGFGKVAAAQEGSAAGDDVESAVAAEGAAAEELTSQDAEQPAQEPKPEPSPEAKAANEAFESLVGQWNGLVEQLKALQKDRDAAQGETRAEFDRQMAEIRKQTSDLMVELTDAGLAVYKADAAAYPRVNATLLAISQFYLVGDAQGDGGDQYEKALPLIKSMIDMGAATKWPELYMTGGAAAYCVGEFDLAEEYLKRAQQAGLFDRLPRQTEFDPPSTKLLHDAAGYLAALPTHRQHWAEEQRIRSAEASANDLPRVKLTTTKGDIVIELFENEAPQSVANFVTLVKKGYYDGVVFHRVLPLFMAQGGDPDGTGGGGPGYTIRDEQGLPNARRHFRGSLSMANKGKPFPNSGGSQFFLTFVPTSYLDGGHTVFGRVLEGMDVAASLRRRNPDAPGPKPTPDKILKAEVLRDRGHGYEFEQLPE